MSRPPRAPPAAPIAELERHVLERQAQHLGGDLGHDRIGAGARCPRSRSRLELPSAVRTALALAAICCRPPRPRPPCPSRPARALAHRTRAPGRAPPSRTARRLAIAFAQLLARERLAVVLVLLRVVHQPQLERIESAAIGELVHRAFEGADALPPRCPHVARRVQVERDDLWASSDVLAAVELARPVDTPRWKSSNWEVWRNRVVADRGEAPVASAPAPAPARWRRDSRG